MWISNVWHLNNFYPIFWWKWVNWFSIFNVYIKKEIRTELGYQITEIFNEQYLVRFKEKQEKTIVEFDYDTIKSNAGTETFLKDFNYYHIKNLF